MLPYSSYGLLTLTLLLTSSQAKTILDPPVPQANSPVSFSSPSLSSTYSLVLDNSTICNFSTNVIPCDCLMAVGEGYQLIANGSTVLEEFAVGPPNVQIVVPSNHEILQELNIVITPKLCLAENYTIFLRFRTFEVMPFDDSPWRVVDAQVVTLHRAKTTVSFPCERFFRSGYYEVEAVSSTNSSIQATSWIAVNQSHTSSLTMRTTSIFPSCADLFTISWKLPSCRSPSLAYNLRVFAVLADEEPIRELIYIEELPIPPSQTTLEIPCSQFDIIHSEYCFELASVDEVTHAFHLWHHKCVFTEPAVRQDGGWTAWSSWSECSTTCGEGVKRRSRYCESPPPDRGKDCIGDTIETRPCQLRECPKVPDVVNMNTRCSCGCELEEPSGTFFATACAMNTTEHSSATWWIPAKDVGMNIEVVVEKQGHHHGRLMVFRGAPYEDLQWKSPFSGAISTLSFSLSSSLHFVYEGPPTNTTPLGFVVAYVMIDSPSHLPVHYTSDCVLLCPENGLIGIFVLIFIVVLIVPPFVCAKITAKLHREQKSGELPLIHKSREHEMIRSGNTECTQLSNRHSGPAYVSKRSIGIQLSVQSTPRVFRSRLAMDSPLTTNREGSSLSASQELEYDYYDGALMRGSIFRPVELEDTLSSHIDVDQIIAQAERVIGSVEQASIGLQSDRQMEEA